MLRSLVQCSVLLLAMLTTITTSQAAALLAETLEGYSLGDSDGQGGWVDFGGTRPANIVNTIASSGSQSIEFSTNPGYGSDSTLDLAAPVTSGQIELSFDLYLPTGYDGTAHIFLSRGPTLTGTFDEGMHFFANGTAGTFSDSGSPTTPLLVDQWVSIVVTIDLDADTAIVTYGGTEVFNAAWNNGGASPTQFQGINIWAAEGLNTAAFNIDNLFLVDPVPVELSRFSVE